MALFSPPYPPWYFAPLLWLDWTFEKMIFKSPRVSSLFLVPGLFHLRSAVHSSPFWLDEPVTRRKEKKKKERNLPGFPSLGGGSSHPIYFYKDAPPFEEHNATTPSTFRVKDFYYFRTSHFCRESVLCVQVTLSYAYFLLALLPDYFTFYLLSWPFELNNLTDRPPARLSASFEYFNAALLRIVSTD